MIPVYGFGAKCLLGEFSERTSHCLALNFKEENPEVKGVDGILQTYNDCFDHLKLSAPTNFAEFITNCTDLANDHPVTQENQHYNILLAITDGEISDITVTLEAIKRATRSPLSIIIVGVGKAKFDKIKTLDGDDKKSPKDVSFQLLGSIFLDIGSCREISFSLCHSESLLNSTSLCWQKRRFVRYLDSSSAL
jgi:hypothetical protein